MKTPSVTLLLTFTLCMAGCASGTKHLSPEEFKALYAVTPYIATMRSLTYIGHSNEKAYIEESRMRLVGNSWKTRVYYVHLNELDPAFRDELLNPHEKKTLSDHRLEVAPSDPALHIPEAFKIQPDATERQPANPADAATIKY